MTTGTEPTLTTDSIDAMSAGEIQANRRWPAWFTTQQMREQLRHEARDIDPTPWCSGGHMTEASCTCGEIDSHD